MECKGRVRNVVIRESRKRKGRVWKKGKGRGGWMDLLILFERGVRRRRKKRKE